MSSQQTSWRINWNSKLYDVETRYQQGLQGLITIIQSKGDPKKKHNPQPNDKVFICWKNHVRMEGKIIRGFTEGIEHQLDGCNIGNDRPHAIPEISAIIEVKSVEPRNIRHMGQHTWLKLSENV